VIVVDSSAWIEFFRRTGGRVRRSLARLVRERAELAVTKVVLEAFSGATSARRFATLGQRWSGFRFSGCAGWRRMTAQQTCIGPAGVGGEAVRKVTDCLVAVAAIEANATVLQADRDFEKPARHTFLRTEPLDE
jgi:predicted nucleic acid-binding protein